MKNLCVLFLFVFLSTVFNIYAMSEPGLNQKDGYTIYITDTKGKITKEKLDVKKKVTYLGILFSTVTGLDTDSFCAIPDVESIDINGNYEFPRITKEHFECTKNLKTLRITNLENVSTIETGAFGTLQKLTLLKLADVSLPSLTKNMFDGLLNLESLHLISCKITNIDPAAFTVFPNLKILDLGHNEINTFKPGTFSHIKNVQEIYLNKNNITELDWEAWEPLPNLEELDFGDNKITKFDVKKSKEYFPVMKRLNIGDSFSELDKTKLEKEVHELDYPVYFQNYY